MLTYSILPVVSYGFETWSLTLREKQTESESRAVRRKFGYQREGGSNGRLEKLHNEKLNN
jgi:hypothetical protein